MTSVRQPLPRRARHFLKSLRRSWMLTLFVLPALVTVFIFSYIPMYGVKMAFQDFRPALGLEGSKMVGFAHFLRFFRSYQFSNLLENTLLLSLYGLAAGFPLPILLALMLNQMRSLRFKRVMQTATYLPHFISTVVLAGMITIFLSPSIGLYGVIARALGVARPANILANREYFRSIYVLSGVWQHTGWDSIIYVAALASIDPSLYEAATIDGANRLQKTWYIDLPMLKPTIVILLIISVGSIMNVGYEKVFLLQNDVNLPRSEVISTYVYKSGVVNAQYGFSAAVGLFNALVNFILLIIVNFAARKLADYSLW